MKSHQAVALCHYRAATSCPYCYILYCTTELMSPNILRGRRDKYWKYFEIFLLIALYDLIFWSWQEGIRKFSGISVHPRLERVVPDTDNSFFLPSQVSSIKEEPGLLKSSKLIKAHPRWSRCQRRSNRHKINQKIFIEEALYGPTLRRVTLSHCQTVRKKLFESWIFLRFWKISSFLTVVRKMLNIGILITVSRSLKGQNLLRWIFRCFKLITQWESRNNASSLYQMFVKLYESSRQRVDTREEWWLE